MIRLAMVRHNLDQTAISAERLKTALNSFVCVPGSDGEARLLAPSGRKEYARRLSRYGTTYTSLDCSFTDQIEHDHRRAREAFDLGPMKERVAKIEMERVLANMTLQTERTTCA